jgi:hypothetical protein
LSYDVISDDVPAALDQVTIGVVISMILGVFCFLAILLTARLYCKSKETPSPLMDAWKSRTSSAFPVHAMGIVFQSLGLITGFAAPAIPWMSSVFSASLSPSASIIYSTMTYTYSESSGKTVSGILPIYIYIGTIIAYIALCSLVFPSLLLSWVVACRMSNVSKWGTAPPIGGTCNAGMPVVQGLAWGGTILFLYVFVCVCVCLNARVRALFLQHILHNFLTFSLVVSSFFLPFNPFKIIRFFHAAFQKMLELVLA